MFLKVVPIYALWAKNQQPSMVLSQTSHFSYTLTCHLMKSHQGIGNRSDPVHNSCVKASFLHFTKFTTHV